MTRLADKLWHVLMQTGRCVLCGEALFLTHPPHTFGAFSAEHKLPAHLGGSEKRRNRAGSHHECNKARGKSPRLRLVRPEPLMNRPLVPGRYTYREGYRRIVPSIGIWWSHFSLPLRREVPQSCDAPQDK